MRFDIHVYVYVGVATPPLPRRRFVPRAAAEARAGRRPRARPHDAVDVVADLGGMEIDETVGVRVKEGREEHTPSALLPSFFRRIERAVKGNLRDGLIVPEAPVVPLPEA